MPITLRIVTGVSIGAINGACIVGAKGKSEAERRKTGRDQLKSLWNDLKLATPFHGRYPMPFGWPSISPARDMSLLGLPGFYTPRPDVWNFPRWTSIYDTSALKETLGKHVCFKAIDDSKTGFVVSAVDVVRRHVEALPQCGGSREARAAAGRGRRGRAVHRRAHHGEREPRAAVSRGPGSARSSIGTAALSTTRRWATRWRPFRKTMGLSAAGRDESLSADRQGAEESARRRGSRARIELRQSRAAGPRSRAPDQQAAAARRGPRKGSREESRRGAAPAGRSQRAATRSQRRSRSTCRRRARGKPESTTRRACAISRRPQSMNAAGAVATGRRLSLQRRWLTIGRNLCRASRWRWLRRSAEICDKAPAGMFG